MTIADFNFPLRLLNALESGALRPVLYSGDQALTSQQLAMTLRRYALHMRRRGVDQGSTVAILTPSRPTAFMLALAAGLLGAAWVINTRSMPAGVIPVTHNLFTGRVPEGVTLANAVKVDQSWTGDVEGENPYLVDFAGYSDRSVPFAYMSSSGTTGRPKYMRRPAGAPFFERVRARIADYSVIGTLFPLTSSLGFAYSVTALIEGKTVVILEAGDGKAPGQLEVYATRGVDYVLGSPLQVNGLCRGVRALRQKVPYLWVGGAAMSARDIKDWGRYFSSIHLSYGSRELGEVASREFRDTAEIESVEYDVNPGSDIEVVGDDFEPLAAGTEGQVRVRLTDRWKGYVGFDAEAAGITRAGWFYPGDAGLFTPQGRLLITGRTSDILNIGGVKFHAGAVDAALAAIPGVAGAVCFSVDTETGPRLKAGLVLAPDCNLPRVLAEAAGAVRRVTGEAGILAGFCRIAGLPMNEMGKVDRGAAKTGFSAAPHLR